jgi:FtsP/CotA-like multicopper oxidase with cupredoxin domain
MSGLICDLPSLRPQRLTAEADQVATPDWAEGTSLHQLATFETFGCDPATASPPTPDRVTPDIAFVRKVHSGAKVKMPDGVEVRFWGFEDPTSGVSKPFPSPTIRVRQGQVVHTRLEASKNAHTIHHHGIEPLPFNDGVGHTSFETTGSYTYQWRAAEAGTYFYHCHVNTVLHVEMGMYGLLIVDPPNGPGTLYAGGPAYDVEAMIVADDCDPRWHVIGQADHHAGVCSGDPGLERFEPKYFLINGVPSPRSLTDARCVIRAKSGQRVLFRLLNASYSDIRLRVAGLPATIHMQDARPLDGRYARPIAVPVGGEVASSSAQRHDLIVVAGAPGTHLVRVEFRHWVTGAVQGVAETRLIVT